MDHEFWLERWHNDRIGFHQPQGNRLLQRWWPELGISRGSRVFVPLCGKTPDMSWLAGRGYRVIGCELSEKAVEGYFLEQGVQPDVESGDRFARYTAGDVTILCGDFFALRIDDLGDVGALYDRAAMIAMPPSMRDRYAAHLLSLLPGKASGLLITLEYNQESMDGPPFSVPSNEVLRLLGDRFEVEELEQVDELANSPRFANAGVTSLMEKAYRLRAAGA